MVDTEFMLVLTLLFLYLALIGLSRERETRAEAEKEKARARLLPNEVYVLVKITNSTYPYLEVYGVVERKEMADLWEMAGEQNRILTIPLEAARIDPFVPRVKDAARMTVR